MATALPRGTEEEPEFSILIAIPEAPAVGAGGIVRRAMFELSGRCEDEVLEPAFDVDTILLGVDRVEGDVKALLVSKGFGLLVAVPEAVDCKLSPLVALLASPPLLSSPALFLLNVFQSHSDPWVFNHLALQPAPTPSTAAL
jgi:hypothetical protein